MAARTLVAVVVGALCTSCSLGDDLDADLEAARESDELPLYWVGEEFEGLDLMHVEGALSGRSGTFVHGTCEIEGDHGCPPPPRSRSSRSASTSTLPPPTIGGWVERFGGTRPRIDAVGPIPPPAPGVLEGTTPCPG